MKRYDSRQKKCTGAYRSVHTISYRKKLAGEVSQCDMVFEIELSWISSREY